MKTKSSTFDRSLACLIQDEHNENSLCTPCSNEYRSQSRTIEVVGDGTLILARKSAATIATHQDRHRQDFETQFFAKCEGIVIIKQNLI